MKFLILLLPILLISCSSDPCAHLVELNSDSALQLDDQDDMSVVPEKVKKNNKHHDAESN